MSKKKLYEIRSRGEPVYRFEAWCEEDALEHAPEILGKAIVRGWMKFPQLTVTEVKET